MQKNFTCEMRKKLNSSQHFLLRNFFARTLNEMSLPKPVLYFAPAFRNSLSLFSLVLTFRSSMKPTKMPTNSECHKNIGCVEEGQLYSYSQRTALSFVAK